MLVVLQTMDIYHPYFLRRPFQIKTNHHNVKYFLEQRILSPIQQKWVIEMLVYDYEIIYKKGKKNVVSSALSTKYEEEVSLFSLFFTLVNWVDEVCNEWTQFVL